MFVGCSLRDVLYKIVLNPKYYPPPLISDVEEAIREVRRKLIELILKQKNSREAANVLDDMLTLKYEEKIASAYYFLTREVRYSKDEAINLIVKVVGPKVEFEKLLPVDEVITNYVIDIIEGDECYPQYPLPLLNHASKIGLIYWDGEKWNTTELGKFLLKLPFIEFVKALLTLETLSEISPENMPVKFLECLNRLLIEKKSYSIDFIINKCGIISNEHYVRSWLTKLHELGVIFINYKENRVETTKYTSPILGDIPYTAILKLITRK